MTKLLLRTTIFYIILVLTNITSSNAQALTLDTANYVCHYNYVWIDDTTHPELKHGDKLVIKIGSKITETYSYNTYHLDSGVYADVQKGMSDAAILGMLPKYGKQGLGFHVLQNYPNNKMTYTNRFINKSFVSVDSMPDFHWNIIEGIDTSIIGYNVQKAVGQYAGRKYFAWFAPDIPVSSGPWKFNGLPGLILKVQDEHRWFWFGINSLENANGEPIKEYYFQKVDFINTSRKEMLEMEYKFRTNPIGFGNQSLGLHIRRTDGRTTPIKKYNPMELF
ncbi:MAG: GLPGLI family protein [Chitinophagaceae bacterium]